MAFNGSLIYAGSGNGTALPAKYIKAESVELTVHVQDLDSTRNANGALIRNVLDHRSATVKFTTPILDSTDMDALMTFIRSRYTNQLQRKLHMRFWNVETASYFAGDFYLAEPTFTVRRVDRVTNTIWYNETTFEFIAY